MRFAYENLEVWNKAIDFAVDVIDIVEKISTDRKHYRLLEQIEACSTSIAMNIAEGKRPFFKKRVRSILLYFAWLIIRNYDIVGGLSPEKVDNKF